MRILPEHVSKLWSANWTWVHNNPFSALHIVSLRQKVNLSVQPLMAFWLYNSFFDEKVELSRDFHIHALVFRFCFFYFSKSNNMKIVFNKNFKFLPFFLRSSLISIFFLTLLKLHQNSAVLNCHYFESKFT